MSFLFLGGEIEGMIMRLVVVGDANPLPEMFSHPEHYFSNMTGSPNCLEYLGTTYQLVFCSIHVSKYHI